MATNHSMSTEILEQYKKIDYENGFRDGAEYVLEYLVDLFEGVCDTNIYKEFFPTLENEENN